MSPLHKGVKCLDVSTGRIYISRDVVFDENVFPFASLHPNAGALLKQQILLLPSSTSSSHEGTQNIDNHMSPVVPITNVQQVEEAAAENFSQNDAQMSSEIDAPNQPQNDEMDTETEVDSAAAEGSEARPFEVDSPASSLSPCRSSPEAARGERAHGEHTPPRQNPPGANGGAPAGDAEDVVTPRRSLSPTSPSPGSSSGSSVAGGGEEDVADTSTQQIPPQIQPAAVQSTVPPPEARTRLQKGIRNPKTYTDGTIRYGMLSSTGDVYSISKHCWRPAVFDSDTSRFILCCK